MQSKTKISKILRFPNFLFLSIFIWFSSNRIRVLLRNIINSISSCMPHHIEYPNSTVIFLLLHKQQSFLNHTFDSKIRNAIWYRVLIWRLWKPLLNRSCSIGISTPHWHPRGERHGSHAFFTFRIRNDTRKPLSLLSHLGPPGEGLNSWVDH